MQYRISAAALIAATSLFLPNASAQEADGEIVVTATRTETPVRALPADVSVINADEALSRGQTTLVQALEDAPGIGAVQSGGAGQQTSLFAGGANSNHTLVLFDGLRLNDPSTPGSSFDAGQDQINGVTRIEIVEGPMSAVFGSDAIGGVVNLIPRHGGEGPLNARLDMSAGSFGTLQGAASVDGTLGRFRYAVTAEDFASEGYDLVPERIVTHVGDDDSSEMSALTGVFDLALSEAFSLDLLVRHREAQAEVDAFRFEFVPPFREFRVDDPDLEFTNDLSLARLGATWSLTEAASLRATAGNLEMERALTDGGALADGFDGKRRFADLTLDWRPGALGVFEKTSLVAGVAGEHEEIDAAQGFGSAPPFSFLTAEQEQIGAFVTAQARANALSLTGAARIDDYEGFGTEATWRVGASFDVTPASRIYAAYGTSFRAPTLYERFVSFGDPNLDPEHGESWEVGADARFAMFGQEEGLELGALYRHTEIKDLINFGALTYENIDEAEIDTAEARIGVRPTSWLTLRAGYVYTDARDAVADTQLLRRPEDAWTASAEVTHGAFSGKLSWRSVGERTDIVYGDDSFSIGVAQTPAYELARLSLAYEFAEGAQAYIAADNALDETYEPVNGIAGAPRAVTVGLRLRAGAN